MAEGEDQRVVQVEFVGGPLHGNSLHKRRIITKADAKAGWGITIPKDLLWDQNNGFKLNVDDEKSLTAEVLERLAEDPKFRLHRA